MIALARAALVVLALGLAALCVRAAFLADFFASFAAVGANAWGLVGLVDLYLGFVLFTFVVVGFDGRRLATLLWVLGLWLLGNIVGAVWLAMRLPRLVAALNASRS